MLPTVALAVTLGKRGKGGGAGRRGRPWNYVESCLGTWDVQRIFLSNFEHIPRNGLSCFSYFKTAFSVGSSYEPRLGSHSAEMGPKRARLRARP